MQTYSNPSEEGLQGKIDLLVILEVCWEKGLTRLLMQAEAACLCRPSIPTSKKLNEPTRKERKREIEGEIVQFIVLHTAAAAAEPSLPWAHG